MKGQLAALLWIFCNLIATLAGFGVLYWFYRDRVMSRINKHAKCPSCGHRNGSIEYAMVPPQPNARPEDVKPAVVHSCKICGAKWVQAVLQPEIWQKTMKEVAK